MIEGHAQGSYAPRKNSATAFLHEGAFLAEAACGIVSYMGRKRTYIRDWRKAKGYTLDQMVGRLDTIGVATTGASLSRIERGEQPYSQDIIEAIAESLGVSVAQLVEDDPAKPPAQVFDFVRHLSEKQAQQAASVLRAMFEKSA